MRNHRFYTPQILSDGLELELPAEVAHHCIQVLRYPIGSELVLFNGDGCDYPAKISAIHKKRCSVTICGQQPLTNESPLEIHLYQGVARGDKMDFIIQKAVELGVSRITPLFTERCNVKLDEKRLQSKLEHWQKVAISASEQSGRARLTEILSPLALKGFTPVDQRPIFYLEPTASQSIDKLTLENSVCLMIGPEGGFSQQDLATLEQIGAQGLRLGPRILRTETAGLTCIAIMQSRFGDL